MRTEQFKLGLQSVREIDLNLSKREADIFI